MGSQFGEKVKELRSRQNLYLREVAPFLEMNTAQLSKIENGFRHIKRNQIPVLVDLLKADHNELLTLWLAYQIYAVIKDEGMANQALEIIGQQIKLEKPIK